MWEALAFIGHVEGSKIMVKSKNDAIVDEFMLRKDYLSSHIIQ